MGQGGPKDQQLSKSSNGCIKAAGMYLTFHLLTFRKYLTKPLENNLEITPFFVTKSAVSPKMSTPLLLMTFFFIVESFSTLKMDVCKKKELSTKRIDREMCVLSSKKDYYQIFRLFFFKQKTP